MTNMLRKQHNRWDIYYELSIIFNLMTLCLACDPALHRAIMRLQGMESDCVVQVFSASILEAHELMSCFGTQQSHVLLPSMNRDLVKHSTCFLGVTAFSEDTDYEKLFSGKLFLSLGCKHIKY